MVPSCEGYNVGDLLPFRIYDPQNLPPLQLESDTRLWLQTMAYDLYLCPPLSEAFSPVSKGQRQSSSTGRPEYWRASGISPKSLKFGFKLPWSSISRALITSRTRANLPLSRRRSNCSCTLNTSVGHANRRAWRELAGCSPTTKKARPAKLNEKSESSGSALTVGSQP